MKLETSPFYSSFLAPVEFVTGVKHVIGKKVYYSVRVQTCYSSPWTLLPSLIISEGVTDFLASYLDRRQLFPYSYIQFE
jgi:hypothetical protein